MAVKSILWFFLIAGLVLPELARAQERPTVIRAATLLDGKGGVMHNVSIVVQGTRITSIDSNAHSVTYDLKGLTVTNVQSVGTPGDRDLRNAIARGTIPGPRLLTSLRPVDETTGTPEQIRAFVRQVVAEWISGSKE